jgi:hypothetical protein
MADADRLTPEEKEALDALVQWHDNLTVRNADLLLKTAKALIESRKPARFVQSGDYVYDATHGLPGTVAPIAFFANGKAGEAARYAAWRNERDERGEM